MSTYSIKMQAKDAGLVAGLSVVCAACIVLCVVLPMYVHPCPSGYTYDESIMMCRKTCSGETGEDEYAQVYNYTTHMCECPSYAPVYDTKNKMCTPKCSAQEVYDSTLKACVPYVPTCSPAPYVDPDGTINYADHYPR